MAFVNSALGVSVAPVRASSKVCAVRASRAVAAPARRPAAVVRMAAEEYPSSDVLGLGKDVPSTLYALMSGPFFIFGVWACYQSNIAHTMTAQNIEYVPLALTFCATWMGGFEGGLARTACGSLRSGPF
jgi:hypothetical protein